MKILVTGAAGFIGFHVAKKLLARGEQVCGIDNLNNYYDPQLKLARKNILAQDANFSFFKMDIADQQAIETLFQTSQFDTVIHLAAQAGVRYSIENPQAYTQTNLVGFANILEGCRRSQVKHLLFASTSSVYGANTLQPFSEHHHTDHPVSFYAATKKANEVMAHSYAYLYGLPCTGLRFFTVYGPWGRPDMAIFKFTQSIIEDKPIEIYNHGDLSRDFTYIDDIVAGVIKVADGAAKSNPNWSGNQPDPATSDAPYRIYNIGNNSPVPLMDFIGALENALDKPAIKKFLPMQAGDVYTTFADVTDLMNDFHFKPSTSIQEGIDQFVAWYREYYPL